MPNLTWQQLPIDTPSTEAFTVDGSFTGDPVSEFTVALGRALQPLPKRLFIDIRGLRQIDRTGIDTMAGLAGLFAESDGGFLAIIGAPDVLRRKLEEGAPSDHFRFFDSFGQAAQKVMDQMLVALSGQFRALPEKPKLTDAMHSCWGGMSKSSVPATQVLTLVRSFDKISSPSFERHWTKEFENESRNLILDVTGLRTMVDEGIDWFRRISETVRGRDGRLIMIGAQPKVRVMLEMLEMNQLFETALSIEEAEGMVG